MHMEGGRLIAPIQNDVGVTRQPRSEAITTRGDGASILAAYHLLDKTGRQHVIFFLTGNNPMSRLLP